MWSTHSYINFLLYILENYQFKSQKPKAIMQTSILVLFKLESQI